jgi:hypothetical protein
LGLSACSCVSFQFVMFPSHIPASDGPSKICVLC